MTNIRLVGSSETPKTRSGADRKRSNKEYAGRSGSLPPTPFEVAQSVNNLLVIIAGHAQNMASGLTPPRHGVAIKEIIRACEMAATENSALLLDKRGARSFSTPANARTIITNVGGILDSLLGPNIVRLTMIDKDCWAIDLNSNDVSAAIVNIAIAARHAMPSGGSFIIKASNVSRHSDFEEPRGLPSGNFIRFSFQDTGVGMSQDELAEVRSPYFSERPPRKGINPGLLHHPKKFARSCGGAMFVDSAKGRGTEVVLMLPAQFAL